MVEKREVTVLEINGKRFTISCFHECDISKYDLTSIKCFFTGGERIQVALLKRLCRKGDHYFSDYRSYEGVKDLLDCCKKGNEKMGFGWQPAFHGEGEGCRR